MRFQESESFASENQNKESEEYENFIPTQRNNHKTSKLVFSPTLAAISTYKFHSHAHKWRESDGYFLQNLY